MSVLVSGLITTLDKYIRDTSTNSVTQAERFSALTEAVVWLIEETTNDHVVRTLPIDYADGVHYYKISNTIADMLESADLRRSEDKQGQPATKKSSREIAEDIGNESSEFAYAIERKDGAAYAVINLRDARNVMTIASFDSTTADGGTWAADTTNSDALNVGTNEQEVKQGSASLSFDVDVSQSGNNRATISNSTLTSVDLSDFLDLGFFILWVYIPDVTYTSSVTLYWGSDSSNYWSSTATTDAEGNAFANGWNKVSFDWSAATKTSSPDETAIDYIRIDVNYSASQADDTSYLLDGLVVSFPERLTFYYLSDRVGTNTGGTTIYQFGATSDVPFFSGIYDHYQYPVCHKAAEILFRAMGLHQDADYEMAKAAEELNTKRKLFPSSLVKEDRSFKAKQLNFNRRKF